MNTLVYLDFECSSVDPETCLPLQIAAAVIDAEDDEYPIMDNGIFVSYMRPPVPDEVIMNPEIVKDIALKKNHIKREDILKFPDEKVVWKNFEKFCLSFKRMGELPVACGWNIKDYDLIIVNRLNKAYKSKRFLHESNFIDLMNLDWIFRHRDPNYASKSFDMAKIHFGIKMDEGDVGHEAYSDVKYGAILLRRYLQFVNRGAKRNKYFRNAFAPKEEDYV